MNKKIRWITQTAVCTALLIVLQMITAPLGNTLITGALVNLVLVISVLAGSLSTGATVAVMSPIFAKLFGIGPLWSIIPCIILGNLSLIILWDFLGKNKRKYILAWIAAAVVKFSVLYVGVVRFTIPVLLKLPEKQAMVMSTAFSLPQLITAGIGGGVALLIVPVLKESRKKGDV